jgi:hypothetical protein
MVKEDDMKAFKSWQSYFQFDRSIKNQSMYIHSTEVETFLQTILKTAECRIEIFPKDSILWRAQLGNGWRFENEEVGEIPVPHKPERMYPRTARATEGRANPKGIPYLYLATNSETALAEVRPWVGSYVTVSQFKIVREMKIVNCTTNKGKGFYLKEPSPKKREVAVWSYINKAFAEPITPTDDVADYVSTQVLAELFKSKGLDGIGYRSSLGDGYNIALFDINSAEIINCFLYVVDGIKFNFSEIANPIFLAKHYKKKKSKST